VLAIIPFNSAKIGWVNSRDIWDKSVNIDGARESLLGMNDFFNTFEGGGLQDDNWEPFEKFARHLKTDEELRKSVAMELPSIGVQHDKIEEWLDNFVDKIREAYADLNFKLYTPESLQSIKRVFGSKGQGNPAF
jgi:hypothetical protein